MKRHLLFRLFNNKGIAIPLVLGICAVSPFVLIHVLYGVFMAAESDLANVRRETFAGPGTLKVQTYVHDVDSPEAELIFIHGTPGDARAFHAQFAKPYPKARLIAVDRPGFGESAHELDTPTLDFQVASLRPLVAKSVSIPRILVGHSYGGPVALALALARVGRVDALLLIGASLDPALEETLGIQRFGNAWPVSELIPSALRVSNRELLTLKEDLLALEKRIAELECPVLMLHGDEDPLVPVENVPFLEKRLTAAGKSGLLIKKVYKGYNHFIPWEHPEAVEQSLDVLMSRLGRSSELNSKHLRNVQP